MNIIRVNETNNVVEIISCSDEMNIDNIKFVTSIPSFEHREGFSGALKYDEDKGLYWEYEEIITVDDLTYTDIQDIMNGVL